MMASEDLAFLADVAALYYEKELSQSEIGRKIGRSRSMVSRLLREAREQGLVEIRIRHPLKTDTWLEDQLIETFGLKAARVLAEPPDEHSMLLARLGALGAHVLQEYLRDNARVGIGWGTAVYELVRGLPVLHFKQASVLQMIGALGSGDPLVDGPELARWLAQKVGGRDHFLHAPLIVEDELVAESLRKQKSIAMTLDSARRADIAIVGIGTVEADYSSLRRAGYVDEDQLQELKEQGAVGDVLARQIDAEGRQLDVSLNRRVIGVELQALRSIPRVIAVAGGQAKEAAILAAVRGGHVNTLVTDARNARVMLNI